MPCPGLGTCREDAGELDVLGRERQQGHVAGTFERERQHALVSRAGAGLAPGLDLGPVGDVTAQAARLLVVDGLHLVDAERADTAASEATTTPTPSRTLVAAAIAAIATTTGRCFRRG